VRSGDNLGLIADRFQTSAANLRAWNGLRSNLIRPGQSLIVNPNGGSDAARDSGATQTASAPAPRSVAPTSGETEYRIRPGDTLGGIAERFGVTASDLRAWNKIRGSSIVAGKTLVVRPPAERPSVAAAATAPSAAIENGGKYRVQSGDTLGTIAERHGVAVDDLMAWNGLASARLTAGQNLLTRPPAGGSRYQVRPGDTLEVIAKRFNVSVDDLMRWNALTSTRIRAGVYLTIRYSERAAGGDD
jgi:membrane-bound lytic murein transglycosylase D